MRLFLNLGIIEDNFLKNGGEKDGGGILHSSSASR